MHIIIFHSIRNNCRKAIRILDHLEQIAKTDNIKKILLKILISVQGKKFPKVQSIRRRIECT